MLLKQKVYKMEAGGFVLWCLGTESLVEWQEHMVLMLQVTAQVWLCSYSGGMTRDQQRQGNTDKYAGMQVLIGRSVAILFIVTRAKPVASQFWRCEPRLDWYKQGVSSDSKSLLHRRHGRFSATKCHR